MATQWFYVDMAQDVTEGKMLPFYFPSSVELSDSIGGKAQMAASVAFMPLQSSPAALYYKEAQSLGKTTGPNPLYLLHPLYVFL